MIRDPLDLGFLPHDHDAARPEDLRRRHAPPPAPAVLSAEGKAWPGEDPSAGTFHYIGQALTPAEFKAYCLDYDFGSSPPSYLIWHHTVDPDASWAPYYTTTTNKQWDRNEAGMSIAQIKAKRKPQLDAIMRYYRDTRGWTVGPHIFTDDLFVWLFTPMYYVGIHANEGNSYSRSGQLRYSVGIEVIGYYDKLTWPESVRKIAGWTAACLKAALNFENKYTSAGQDRPDLHDPQLSGHRDYTTDKTCPGLAITNSYFVQVAADGWAAYQANTPPGPDEGAGVYVVRHNQAVFEAPEPGARVALGDTAEIYEGAEVDIDEIGHGGWAHLRSGLGFVPSGVLTRLR